MHGGELDPETVQGGHELVEEAFVPPDLVHAVADPRRRRPTVLVPDPDLVLDRGHDVVPGAADIGENASVDLARRELARRAVGPARGSEADLPPGTPRELADRPGVRGHDEVGGPRSDPEPLEVRDRRVHRVEAEDQVRHHRSVGERRFERVGPERLPADRAVDVGDAQQDEALMVRGGGHAVPARVSWT